MDKGTARARRRALAVLLVAVLAVVATACEAEGTWTGTQPRNEGTAPPAARFEDVDCASPTSCLAVGLGIVSAWDGSAWSPVAVGHERATRNVSCPSASFCMIDHQTVDSVSPHIWDGTTLRPTADPAGVFGSPGAGRITQALSCPSGDFCAAVVDDRMLHWDGSSWAQVPAPLGWWGGDGALDCSSPTRCIAAGPTTGGNWEMRWDGASWVEASEPLRLLATDIDCIRDDRCIASGQGGPDAMSLSAKLARWDGSTWIYEPLAEDVGMGGFFTSVSCASATWCLATLGASYGAEPGVFRYDGTTWQRVPTPPEAAGVVAVDCGATDDCVAVGYTGSNLEDIAAAWHWDGDRWTKHPVTGTPGVPAGRFDAVACPTDDVCVAYGVEGAGWTGRPSSQVWDGRAWRVVDVPGDHLEGPDLACGSPAFCVVVGRQVDADTGAIKVFDGSAWSEVEVPITEVPRSVSCAGPTFCLVAGRRTVVRWDGTTWAPVPAPFGTVVDLACTSATRCQAAGDGPYDGFVDPKIHTWDGTGWTSTQLPGFDEWSKIDLSGGGISCATADRCVVVGTLGPSQMEGTLAAFTWDGATWEGNELPSTRHRSRNEGVQCSPGGRCLVVGAHNPNWETGGPWAPLTVTTDDLASRSWLLTPPVPVNGEAVELTAAACRDTWCLAVGVVRQFDGATAPYAVRWIPEP